MMVATGILSQAAGERQWCLAGWNIFSKKSVFITEGVDL
jgi:hypothetical protein